jgi:membrane-associated phospholipid phosphatase
MASRSREVVDRLHRADEAVYRAVAGTSTPLLDVPLRRLSTAANRSRLSFGAAAVLAATGGDRGRRAAVTGIASLAVASAVVNVGAKLLTRRRRPDRVGLGVETGRHVPMPTSSSFPSGHSAAAFAFAAGVGHEWPLAAVPLYALATAVAYSRVHTGVHYPGDVVAGVAIGLASASVTSRVVDRQRLRAHTIPPVGPSAPWRGQVPTPRR